MENEKMTSEGILIGFGGLGALFLLIGIVGGIKSINIFGVEIKFPESISKLDRWKLQAISVIGIVLIIIGIFQVRYSVTHPLAPTPSATQPPTVTILLPSDGDRVTWSRDGTVVRGISSEVLNSQSITVLVRGFSNTEYWVQTPPGVIREDGSWSTLAYFGTETEGLRENYKLIAIVTSVELEAGENLSSLPPYFAVDEVIVRREE